MRRHFTSTRPHAEIIGKLISKIANWVAGVRDSLYRAFELMPHSECRAGANPTIEKIFHDCVYDTRDHIGFYFGLCSIACWVVAQLPQLITNYRRKSADALSPFFLAEWLLGDTCNLVGALLQGNQPETVILTAQYFICMDCVLLLQYLYYTAVSRRVERTYALARRRRHHHHGGHHHGGPGAAAGGDIHGHHQHLGHRSRSGHSHQHRQQRPELRSRVPGEESVAVVGEEQQPLGLPPEITAAAAATGQPDQSAAGAAAAGGGGAMSPGGSRKKVRSRIAAGVATAVVGSVMLLQGPSRAATASIVTVRDSSNMHGRSLSFSESLVQFNPGDDLAQKRKWEQTAGSVLGYISCALYLTSRASQIIKNARRGSAEGLASSMFLCAVAANIFYGVGVLLRARTTEEVLSSLPWVLGSLGTVGLDAIILVQTAIYRQDEMKSSDEEEPLLGGAEGGNSGGNLGHDRAGGDESNGHGPTVTGHSLAS